MAVRSGLAKARAKHTAYDVPVQSFRGIKVKIDKKAFSKRELETGEKLIQTLAAPFHPEQFH